MKLDQLVGVSAAVAAAPGRLDKISKLADLLGRVPPDDVPIAIGFLTGSPRQGRIGVGWASVASGRDREAASTPSLELRDVDSVLEQLSSVQGKNSGKERARLLGDLLGRATADEQQFLAALLIGEVRQGALEGVLLEAVAKAAGLPADRVRRAVMMAGDLGAVASGVLGDDREKALSLAGARTRRSFVPSCYSRRSFSTSCFTTARVSWTILFPSAWSGWKPSLRNLYVCRG